MKRLLAALLLTVAAPVVADHYDVIEFKLKEGCSLVTYLQVVKDFNESGKAHGYKAEIAVPPQRASLETIFWVGRNASTEVFGKAWDAWRYAQVNADSVPTKLNGRVARVGCRQSS